MDLKTSAVVAIAASFLSACSTMSEPPTGQHAAMNNPQQCAMYRAATEGKSAVEQRAAAEAHVRATHGTVDEAHIDRHMQMMEVMCGAKPAAGVIGD